jgi:hypothetical protein
MDGAPFMPCITWNERGRMTVHTPVPERRRQDERPAVPPAAVARRRRSGPRRRPWSGREALLRRLRQPVIGLTLAGAALPILATTQVPMADEESAHGVGDELDAARSTDLEEELAERIGEKAADAERATEIASAVTRYGIARDLAEDIYDIALEEDIDPRIAFGLVKVESTFKERAVSPVGARGLAQVMPRTAAWLAPGTTPNDLFDRETNLRLGFSYLNQMIDKYRGNIRLALLAYNRGPGTVDRVLKQGGNPDNGYADKVLRS